MPSCIVVLLFGASLSSCAGAGTGGSGRWSTSRARAAVSDCELGHDPLRELLAELDAPLVERVDVPDRTLGEHLVLVERDELAERVRRELGARIVDDGWLPANTRCGDLVGAHAFGARPRRSVLPNASASGCASRFATSRSWWSPSELVGLREPDEVGRDQLRALVDQLVVGVLAVGAGLAPHDRAGLTRRPGRPRGRPTCRCSPCRAAGSTRAGARGTGCTAAPRASRRRRSRRTRCRSGP